MKESSRRKLILITILILFLPGALQGFWIGLSIYQKASGPDIDIPLVERKLAQKRAKAESAELFTAKSANISSSIMDLERERASAENRDDYVKQLPIALVWIGVSSVLFAFWCYAVHRVAKQRWE